MLLSKVLKLNFTVLVLWVLWDLVYHGCFYSTMLMHQQLTCCQYQQGYLLCWPSSLWSPDHDGSPWPFCPSLLKWCEITYEIITPIIFIFVTLCWLGSKTRPNERFHTCTLQQLLNFIKSGCLSSWVFIGSRKQASSQDRGWSLEMDLKVHGHSFRTLCLV